MVNINPSFGNNFNKKINTDFKLNKIDTSSKQTDSPQLQLKSLQGDSVSFKTEVTEVKSNNEAETGKPKKRKWWQKLISIVKHVIPFGGVITDGIETVFNTDIDGDGDNGWK